MFISRILKSVIILILLLSLCVNYLLLPLPAHALLTDVPINWSNFTFIAATYNGAQISDYESSADPSRGSGAVSPANTDISSCSTDGYLPGSQPSFLYAYYNGGTPGNINDDHLALRMRLNGTPLEKSEVGLDSGHWYILIDIDNDGWKEFAIDIDGTVASNRPDRVYLLYNDLPSNTVTARSGAQRSNSDTLGGDEINLWYAAGPAATGIAKTNNHVRVTVATPSCYGGNEYWLDIQLPISAFKVGGVQKLDYSTPARFLISTSASAVDPLQKDWMLKVLSDPIFSDPWTPVVYAAKKANLKADNDFNGTPSPGDILKYSITITNSGLLDMLDVLFQDMINDPNLKLVDNSVATTGTIIKDTENEVQVSFTLIASGQSAIITFEVEILFPEIPGVSVVSNQGLVTGSNFTGVLTDDPSTVAPKDPTRTEITIPPTLRITKEGPPRASAGSNITFTGTLTNYGNVAARNVVLVDKLPDGLSFVSSSHGAIYDSGNITWQLGTLNGGASIPGWVTVNVSNDIPDNTTLENIFTVSWEDSYGNHYPPATAAAEVTVYSGPLLSITKNGPQTATPGNVLTYTGTLTNYGAATAYYVVLVDILPAGLTFVSSSHGASYDPVSNTITWTLGQLARGASISGWVTVRVDTNVSNGTSLTNTFSVTWKDAEENSYGPEESTAETIIYTIPHLTITKEGPDRVTRGSFVTFTGTLKNIGGSTASSVVLVDYLPPGVAFVSSSHTALYDPLLRTVTWQLGAVGSGVSIPGWVQVYVDASIPNGTLLHNVFSLTWKFGDTSYGPKTATKDVVVYTNPLLTISKTGPAYGSPGDQLTFTMMVTNSGGLDAYNVTVSDILPDKYSYVTSSPAGTEVDGYITWGLGILGAGSSATINLTVKVDDYVDNATILVNNAMVNWQDGAGHSYGPASTYFATTIYSVPNLVITKTGPEYINPGERAKYTITIANTSKTAADNVMVVDYLSLSYMKYVKSTPEGVLDSETVTWNVGTISAGASYTISIVLKAKENITEEVVVPNMVTATWQDEQENNYGPVTAIYLTHICLCPILNIDISVAAESTPCANLPISIAITNTSTMVDADNVIVQYILPSSTTFVSASNGGTYSNGVVTWIIGKLPAKASADIMVTLSFCILPVGSDVVSNAGVIWTCRSQIQCGPVFDTATTRIIAEPTPPEPPTPTPTPEPKPSMAPETTDASSSLPVEYTRPFIERNPPSLYVQNLNIKNDGRSQTICADIYNKGGSGSAYVTLLINGYAEANMLVNMGRGASRQVCWVVNKTLPGNYLVKVGEKSAYFSVGMDGVGTMTLVYGILGCLIALMIGLIVILIYQRLS